MRLLQDQILHEGMRVLVRIDANVPMEEEKILEEKYGQPYSDYKKKVKM